MSTAAGNAVLLLPLHSGPIFYTCKTTGYAHKNEVCNFFASRRHFGPKMCLPKPIGNQTPATSALTSFVTMAKPPLSHDATNAIAAQKAPFSRIHYPVACIHLCTK